ncbi:MAG: hypothetical protein SOZ27_02005 [Spirochaetia bacterium]|nr:hypothetical protein [Spirochaetia bacterium]
MKKIPCFIMVYLVVFLLTACNTEGTNGIFYAITQEVESTRSNLDVKLTAKGMIESDQYLFLIANGLHAAFKDGRLIDEKKWLPLNSFENVVSAGKSHPFLETETASSNCKDAVLCETDGTNILIASQSIDDDYNSFESPNNPEYNKDFRINRIFRLQQTDSNNPTKWKWKEIPVTYPSMKHSYDKVFRQMEVERIFVVNGEVYFLFNEKFIRKKYYITDENGNQTANTEQAVKSPYFTLYRVSGLLSGSPTFTEITMPSEEDHISSVLNLFSFVREGKTETWFTTGRNLYSISGNRAEQVDIYVSAGIGNSGYYLNSKIETITAVYCAAPSPYLTEDQKTLIHNGISYQINNDKTVFMAVTYINKDYDRVNRLFRYTKSVSESIGSGNSALVFDWNWSECHLEGQTNDSLIVYTISDYYAEYTDTDGKKKYINKLVVGTNDGYLEAVPANTIPSFITINYDDPQSTSASNLSTLILESASVIGFFCADRGTSNGKLFAFTASNGVWVNNRKIWSRE